MNSKTGLFLLVGLLIAASFPPPSMGQPATFQLTQWTPLTFNAWRPYKDPAKMVQIGMNKGQVLAAAGGPDREEFYYQGSRGRLLGVSDWYYLRTGFNSETTLLKFVGETLVSIVVNQVP
jgi:hypothetical protein